MLRSGLLMSLVLVPGAVMSAAEHCTLGDAASRLDCLMAQRCPEATSAAAQASCYREIALQLLASAPEPGPINELESVRTAERMHQTPAASQGVLTTRNANEVTSLATSPTVPATPDEVAQVSAGSVETAAKPDPAPVAASATSVPQAETQARDAFGLDWKEVERVEIDDLTARVTGVTRQPRGTYLFKLDNGQLWEQTEKRRLKMTPGDEIRIARMSLRSFKLFPATGVSCKVRRLDCQGEDADPRCGYFDDA